MKKDVNRKQPEFKQNAVKLTEKIGVVSTAEKLRIPLSTLQRWKAHNNLPIEIQLIFSACIAYRSKTPYSCKRL